MPYNPFDKPIGSQLIAADLDALLGKAAEGYFIEYKEDFPAPKKIAHSIASLANTFGGWYIVGVRTDESHVANEICGFSSEAHPDPVAKIRDVVKARIDPVPVFYAYPVSSGPHRSVLVVFVPAGQRTPFVTNDGRIYRRNHDSSDPVPETSRHTLDHLVEQGKDTDRRFERFCEAERTPNEVVDRNLGWVNIFISPEPLGVIHKADLHAMESLDQLLEMSRRPRPFRSARLLTGASGNLPFSHIQTTHQSVLLRQAAFGSITKPGVVAELFIGGSARFHIPVHVPDFERFDINSLRTPAVRDVLQEVSREDRMYLNTFDVPYLYARVLLLVLFYLDWLGRPDWLPAFKTAFSLRGFWNAIPIVDSNEWAEQASRWGLSVLPSDIQFPENWQNAPIHEVAGEDEPLWFPLLHDMALALGLSTPVFARSVADMLSGSNSAPA